MVPGLCSSNVPITADCDRNDPETADGLRRTSRFGPFANNPAPECSVQNTDPRITGGRVLSSAANTLSPEARRSELAGPGREPQHLKTFSERRTVLDPSAQKIAELQVPHPRGRDALSMQTHERHLPPRDLDHPVVPRLARAIPRVQPSLRDG